MKTKFSKLFGALAVIFSFTISSCQKDQVDPISSATPTPLVTKNFVEWAKNAKVVPDSTDKYLLSYDSIELRFADRGDKFMETVKAGEILASNLGYLRFVDRVEKEGDQLVLHTHKAEITDAIRNCYIEVETPLQPVGVMNSRTEARVLNSTFWLRAWVKSGGANANAKASLSVTYDLNPVIKFVMEIKSNGWLSTPTLVKFDASVGYIGTLTKKLKVEGAMGFSYSATLLNDYPFAAIVPIPGISITPKLGITGDVSGEASGVWEWTIVKRNGTTVGANYNITNRNAWTPYRISSEGGSRTVTANVTASATVAITPRITLSLYNIDKLGSASLGLRTYVRANARLAPTSSFSLTAGVQGSVGTKICGFSNNWANVFTAEIPIF